MLRFLFFTLLIALGSTQGQAQQIVLLEDGREIKLMVTQNSKAKVGEDINFKIKYDVYTEDNLVIESESKVVGKIMGKNQMGDLLIKIDNVHDLHGNAIEVRTYKNGNDYLQLKADQKEATIYVDQGFWFSY